MDFFIEDDQYKSRIVTHGNEVGHIFEQKDRDVILERNKRLRANPGALRDLTFGRQVASIPFEDWQTFLEKHPDYRQMDKEKRLVTLMTWLKTTPEGRACMVYDDQYKCQTKYFEVNK